MTPAMMLALVKRKHAEWKKQTFLAGIVASQIYNANRSKEQRPINAFDFVPDEERDRQQEQLRQTVMSLYGTLAEFDSKADRNEIRRKVTKRLMNIGHSQHEIEEIFQDVFVAWKVEEPK